VRAHEGAQGLGVAHAGVQRVGREALDEVVDEEAVVRGHPPIVAGGATGNTGQFSGKLGGVMVAPDTLDEVDVTSR
jgi:hypothetical protein